MTSTTGADEALPLRERVVEAIADATDSSPADIEPIYERVDPDGLDRLFSDAPPKVIRDEGHVAFPMAGCQVVIHADETIVVKSEDDQRTVSLPDVRADSSPTASESSSE